MQLSGRALHCCRSTLLCHNCHVPCACRKAVRGLSLWETLFLSSSPGSVSPKRPPSIGSRSTWSSTSPASKSRRSKYKSAGRISTLCLPSVWLQLHVSLSYLTKCEVSQLQIHCVLLHCVLDDSGSVGWYKVHIFTWL